MKKNIPIVAYDARMIEHSGIGVRILNLLNKIHLYKPDSFQIVLLGNLETLKKYNLDKYYKIVEYNAKIYSLKELLGFFEMRKFDLIDIPHFNIPIFYSRKMIVTIHDIIPWKLKEFFPEKSKRIYMKIIFTIIKLFSQKVVSVSEHTKKDLIEEFQFNESQIVNIYNGIDFELFREKSTKEISAFTKKYNLPKEYLLTIGIGKDHKNVSFLIEALKQKWKDKKFPYKLIIAGANGKVPHYLEKVILGFEDKIIFFPRISFDELPILYSRASLFVYPSLYEGFGFPVLEAQAMSCPVLSSNASVLPEVLGNSANYFHPKDQEEFLRMLDESLSNSKDKKRITDLGLKNIRRFSWEHAAQRTILLYEELLKIAGEENS